MNAIDPAILYQLEIEGLVREFVHYSGVDVAHIHEVYFYILGRLAKLEREYGESILSIRDIKKEFEELSEWRKIIHSKCISTAKESFFGSGVEDAFIWYGKGCGRIK